MRFWQNKYPNRGFRLTGTVTKVTANIPTRIAPRALKQHLKNRPCKELFKSIIFRVIATAR